MKFTNVLGAVAASGMLLGLAIPASAAGLMDVTTTGTTTINGNIDSTSTSWDKYAGVQLTASTTVSENSSVNSALSPTSLVGASTAQENFAGQVNVTFFKGGDNSSTVIKGGINQTQTSVSSGIQTSFGN